MATGTIPKLLSISDVFATPVLAVSDGSSVTITFSSARANGLISITGSSMARIALYAFSGVNGAIPVFNKLNGANLDSFFSTATGTLTFSPNYGAQVEIIAFNNSGNIIVSQSS